MNTLKSFGGVRRQEDINLYNFYQHHGPNMPALNKIIAQLLGQPEASHTPEKIFSRCGHVINEYRTNLLTQRAQKLILSSCCFSFELFGCDLFFIPTCGQLFTTEELKRVHDFEITGTQHNEFSPDEESDNDAVLHE